MERTYYLDLKTLLEYLRGKSAVLRTTIMLPKPRQRCQGHIFLKRGTILRCYILGQDGALLFDGQDAYAYLGTSAEWYVRIDTDQVIEREAQPQIQEPPPYPNVSPLYSNAPPLYVSAESLVLRPLRPLEMNVLQQFPPKRSLLLRTVFTMVNGERSVAQIKAQLRLPTEVVTEALNILQDIGVIG